MPAPKVLRAGMGIQPNPGPDPDWGTMPRTDQRQPPQPNIADPYRDLLAGLDEGRRRGVVQQLADGYYQGWRPTRAELAHLISRTGATSDGPSLPAATTVVDRPHESVRVADAIPRNQSSSSSRARIRQGVLSQSAPLLPILASFEVDCGELLPHFRFVATSLTHDGTTVRDQTLCRMTWLNYELIPTAGLPDGHQMAQPPALFTGPILCISDTKVHIDDDGRRRRHSVNGAGAAGSRGPWPLIMTTRQMRFLIGQNPPGNGGNARQQPAGALVVDISAGTAIWQPRV